LARRRDLAAGALATSICGCMSSATPRPSDGRDRLVTTSVRPAADETWVVNRIARTVRVDWSATRHALVAPCARKVLRFARPPKLLAVSTSTRTLYAGYEAGRVPAIVIDSASEAEIATTVPPGSCRPPEPRESLPDNARQSFLVVNGSHGSVELEWWPYERENAPSSGRAVVRPCSRRRLPVDLGRYTRGVSSPDGPVQVGLLVEEDIAPSPVLIDADGSVAGGDPSGPVGCAR
jgi:hypothetical protein